MSAQPQNAMPARTAAQQQLQKKVNDFRGLLEKMKSQIALAIPSHIKPERLARVALTSVQRVPKLLDCTRESLLGAIMQAAQLGLEPDGLLGHAYLVPYKAKCQLIVGYKGLLQLARRSGQISTIQAHAVHQKDMFEFWFGLEPELKHVPTADEDPGSLIAVYAVAKMKDASIQFDVMRKREVDAIRKRSMAANDGPWVTDYEEMAKKTVLRRLCKMLPCSIEMEKAVALDEQVDAGIAQTNDSDFFDISALDVTPEEEEQPPTSKLTQFTQEATKGAPQPAQQDGASPSESANPNDELELTDDQYDLITETAREANVKWGMVQAYAKDLGYKLVKTVRQKDFAKLLEFAKTGNASPKE